MRVYSLTARASIHSVLDQAITKGQLTIYDPEGMRCYGRQQTGCNDVHLTVTNNNFWTRVLVSGDVGCETSLFAADTGPFLTVFSVSEAYMVGDVEIKDLRAVMNVCSLFLFC